MTLTLPSPCFSKALLGSAFLLLIGALLLADAPWLHDFAEWLYQAQIVRNLVLRPETMAGMSLVTYPVPNSLSTVLLAALASLVPAIWAGKLLLIMLLAAWYAVIRVFVRRHFPTVLQDSTGLVLFTLLALASFFWYGFVGYQLGLLLLTWFLALDEERTGPGLILVFSVALFFAHAMVFLVFGLLLCIRALLTRSYSILVALAPSGLLALWFLAGRQTSAFKPPIADAHWSGWPEALMYKMGFPAMLGPFKNFLQPSGASLFENQAWVYWAGFFSNFAVVCAVGLFVLLTLWKSRSSLTCINSGSRSIADHLTVTTFTLCVLYIVAPYNFFGLINPGGRLLLPIIIMTLIVGQADLAKLIRLVFWPVALFTLITCVSYSYLVLTAEQSEIAASQIVQPAVLPSDSVFKYNQALYANTRFSYFNYRIFAFSDRFDRMEAGDYERVAFQTGLIVRDPGNEN